MSTPYMQLYVADYLGDTQHLTTEQHGAYLLLLMAMWRAGGYLPNDPAKLARIARIHPPRWARVAPEIMAFFEATDDGRLTQKRLLKEHEKASHKCQSRTLAGAAGGRAKALKTKEAALANATVLPWHLPEPEPEPDNINPPDNSESDAAREPVAASAAEGFEEFWTAYPKRKGANPRHIAEKRFRNAVKAGADPAAITAGARAYAAELDAIGKLGTPYVAQAVTWLNQRRWEDYRAAPGAETWTPPPDFPAGWPPNIRVLDPEHAFKLWDQDQWDEIGHLARSWGPPPGREGCKLPDAVQRVWLERRAADEERWRAQRAAEKAGRAEAGEWLQ